MSGGLMQLVAYGAQDIYLTGNAQITFFKVVYRRHTNFSMESIEQTFNGQADFSKKVTATISRNGDLIHRIYLQVTLPEVVSASGSAFRWVNWVGHVLVNSVEVEIGGQRIDKHYGYWMHIWNELTQTAGHQAGYANMVGNVPRLTQPVTGGEKMPSTTLFVPLQFWFCRNPGLALPLIALQYHEVKINLEFSRLADCSWTSGNVTIPSLTSASLWVDYIYLDTDERRRFAQVSHEYLIEQLQFTGDESVSTKNNKIKLNFNHPVKELVWVVQPDSNTDANTTKTLGGPQWFNFTDRLDETYFSGTPSDPLGGGMGGASSLIGNFPYSLPMAGGATTGSDLTAGLNIPNAGNSNTAGVTNMDALSFSGLLGGSEEWSSALRVFDRGANPVANAKLQLNGHDRFYEREGRYFNLVQPYQHHENVPATGVNVYSFALKPEDHQPSGTCNFSRIDNATLQLTLTEQSVVNNRPCKIKIYAVNYNVLRIMSGMGGLAYSN
jgi:hypothetical protein